MSYSLISVWCLFQSLLKRVYQKHNFWGLECLEIRLFCSYVWLAVWPNTGILVWKLFFLIILKEYLQVSGISVAQFKVILFLDTLYVIWIFAPETSESCFIPSVLKFHGNECTLWIHFQSLCWVPRQSFIGKLMSFNTVKLSWNF